MDDTWQLPEGQTSCCQGHVAHLYAFYQTKLFIAGQIALAVFKHKKREAACLRIQKELRRHLARSSYLELCSSALVLECGMRGMDARNKLRFRKQTRASIVIQVKSHSLYVEDFDSWNSVSRAVYVLCNICMLKSISGKMSYLCYVNTVKQLFSRRI